MFWRAKRDAGLDAQIDAAMAWTGEHLADEELLALALSARQGTYKAVWSPKSAGRTLHHVAGSLPRDDNDSVRFLITASHETQVNDKWRKLLRTLHISVFENTHKSIPQRSSATGPLHQHERELVLSIARKSLAYFLQFHRVPNVNPRKNATLFPLPKTLDTDTIPDRFLQKADVNVALWCDGALRGSFVVENQHLVEGIVLGVLQAARDHRFKPLAKGELERTRIEVSVLSDLRVPLSETERYSDGIYPELGYVYSGGVHNGWLLPEVHNVRQFQGLTEFLHVLAKEKARVTEHDHSQVNVLPIDSFIESADRGRTTKRLRGPVVWDTPGRFSKQKLESALQESAAYICRQQESDGYLPSVLQPLSARKKLAIDWPRMAFTCFALSEFANATGSDPFRDGAAKGYAFITQYLKESQRNISRPVANRYVTSIYTARLATSLGRTREARELCHFVTERIPDMQTFDPIVFGQLMSLLLTQKPTNYLEERIEYVASVAKRQFESHVQYGSPMSHAAWSEFVVSFHMHDPVFSDRVAEWLMSAQLPSGAFADSTVSSYEYARGTTKIFEVLCRDYTKYQHAIEKALNWIYNMRYNDESMYFMSTEVQKQMRGGLRADLLSPDVHIDAVGHFLLGGAYCIEQEILHDRED